MTSRWSRLEDIGTQLEDKRSYRVSFEKFKQLASGYTPEVDLVTTVAELRDGLNAIGFKDENFRQSHFIRLNVLTRLKYSRKIRIR